MPIGHCGTQHQQQVGDGPGPALSHRGLPGPGRRPQAAPTEHHQDRRSWRLSGEHMDAWRGHTHEHAPLCPCAQLTSRPSLRPSLAQVSTYACIWPARRLPGCEVVAVAARDGKRAAEFARQHGWVNAARGTVCCSPPAPLHPCMLWHSPLSISLPSSSSRPPTHPTLSPKPEH